MANWQDEYWQECISIAADDCGLLLTTAQLDCLASSVRGGHENYGMASGDDVASSNLSAYRDREKEDLLKAVRREKAKVTCRECNGHGRITMQAGPWTSNSECSKCRGEGRHDP
ncbi:hypothetical protein [Devosia sp. 2618]|uniref:hypothetical protein n=1 Tax=Devosia sp. 2618 TaxID=3156454 RepID=UPI003391FB9E